MRWSMRSLRHGSRKALDVLAAHGVIPWWSTTDAETGMPLPPRRLRPAGPHFRDDAAFMASGRREAQLLNACRHITSDSVIVDFGCGPGRLAIGMLGEGFQPASYIGIDVQLAPLVWASRHLTPAHREIEFRRLGAYNERYARRRPAQAVGLPVGDDVATHGHAYSVFSHLLPHDVELYLMELRRVLRSDGVLRLTAFVEEGVPDVVENPPDYGRTRWVGPLHCVRYERSFFLSIVDRAGFQVEEWYHGTETDGQSAVTLRPH